MPRQLTTAQNQQLSQQQDQAMQTHEHSAKAQASAGLNLNLFSALSGALSSSSRKSTQHNSDGSSVAIEERHDKAAAQGVAHANGRAFVQGSAEERERKREQQQRLGRVDHLGIEG